MKIDLYCSNLLLLFQQGIFDNRCIIIEGKLGTESVCTIKSRGMQKILLERFAFSGKGGNYLQRNNPIIKLTLAPSHNYSRLREDLSG